MTSIGRELAVASGHRRCVHHGDAGVFGPPAHLVRDATRAVRYEQPVGTQFARIRAAHAPRRRAAMGAAASGETYYLPDDVLSVWVMLAMAYRPEL